MKLLIAGGLGFIGSEVCRQLLQHNYVERVYVVDDNSKGYGTSNVADLLDDHRFEWINIDLSNPSNDDDWLLSQIISDVDFVVGLAAKIGGIGYFNKIPATILRDNNLIQTTLLDKIVESKNRPRFINMSSSMVFESATKFPSKESDLASTIIPVTSYGMSKLVSEYYCKAYAAQYGLEYTIVRPFNAVGPERPDPNFVGFSHVIPDLICKIKNGQGHTEGNPIQILGDGKQVRHYTDVREIADAVLLLTQLPHMSRNEDFNVAIDKGHTVLDLVDLIWKEMHPELPYLPFVKSVPGFAHDVQNRVPDTSKMDKMFGWKARYYLEDSIKEVIPSVLKLLE